MQLTIARFSVAVLLSLSLGICSINSYAQRVDPQQPRPATPAPRPAPPPPQARPQRPAATPSQPVARPPQQVPQNRPARPAPPPQPARPSQPVTRPANPPVQHNPVQPSQPVTRPVNPPAQNRPVRPSQPTTPVQPGGNPPAQNRPVRPSQPGKPTVPVTRPGEGTSGRPSNGAGVKPPPARPAIHQSGGSGRVTVNNTQINRYYYKNVQVNQQYITVNRYRDRSGRVTIINQPPRRIYPGRYVYYYHPYRPYYWGPSWYPIGFWAAALATTAAMISFQERQYYYDQGVYYAPAVSGGGYAVVPAPVGAVVYSLPSGYTTVSVGGYNYYYYGGVFYIDNGNGSFEVVAPPSGAIVYELPAGAQEVIISGRQYVVYNGTYYMPFSNNGQYGYEVVGVN